MDVQFTQNNTEIGEQVILVCEKLLAEKRFDEVITWVEHTINSISPKMQAQVWAEAFEAAKGKGDTELAKSYMMEIAQVEPTEYIAADEVASELAS